MLDAAETGSLTAAAERGNIVLAAASTRIRKLEDRLSVRLFDRNRYGVQLTPAGEVMVRHARSILDHSRQLDAEMADFAGGTKGIVRLLSNTNALAEHLPQALGRFLAANPDIGVVVDEKLSHDIVQAVSRGEADIGIVAATVDMAGLQASRFAIDRLVVVAPQDSLLPQGPIPFSDVLDELFVGLQGDSAIQAYLQEIARQMGRALRLRMRLFGFDAVCRMVESGAGIAIVPETAAKRCHATMRIRTIPLQDPWSLRDMHLCVRDEKALPAYAKALLTHLREHQDCR